MKIGIDENDTRLLHREGLADLLPRVDHRLLLLSGIVPLLDDVDIPATEPGRFVEEDNPEHIIGLAVLDVVEAGIGFAAELNTLEGNQIGIDDRLDNT